MEIGYTKILATTVIAVLGWLIGHYFSNKREIKAKQRELVTKQLIDSFEAIATFSAVLVGNAQGTEEVAENFNNAITKIQLLGNDEQIKIVHDITEMLSQNSPIQLEKFDRLLNNVRETLRNELNLTVVSNPINVAHITWQGKSINKPNKVVEPISNPHAGY